MNRAKKINLRAFEESRNLYNKVNVLYDLLQEVIDIIDYNNNNIDLDRFSQYGLDQIDERIKAVIEDLKEDENETP